jgi:hypothetical protein
MSQSILSCNVLQNVILGVPLSSFLMPPVLLAAWRLQKSDASDMPQIPHFDFVYVNSYNECDAAFLTGLHDAFRRAGLRFAVVGYVSTYVEGLVRETGVQFFNLRQLGRLKPLPEQDWPPLEERLGQPIRSFVFPESRYYMTPLPKLAARVKSIIEGFDRLCDHISVGAYIHKLGAEVVRRVLMTLAETQGAHTVMLGTFPAQFIGRTYLHEQFWSERDETAPPPRNSADEVDFATFCDMLVAVRERRQVIRYPLYGTRSWSEALPMLLSMLAHREEEFIGDIVSRQRELLRFRFRNLMASLLVHKTLPQLPFFFFPLHVFDDSQITARNPEFYDQSWIIEQIANALPAGMKLVVKLHPGLDGAVSLAFLRKMRNLKEVHLLDGKVNAHEVIARSEAVITINSTVGLEALLHAKPVLVLGRWTFGQLGMTRHLRDFTALPQTLLQLRRDKIDLSDVERKLYDLFGEMSRFSYNRLPIDYNAMVASLQSKLSDRQGLNNASP